MSRGSTSGAERPVARTTAWLATAGIGLAVALAWRAISLYPRPGGYRFFSEFWCDLYDPETAGLVNGGSWWAVAATCALGVGLAAMFGSLRGPGFGRLAWLGWIGCTGFAFVPVVTALGWLGLHLVLVLVTGPIGLAAIAWAVWVSPHRAAAVAGWALLGLGAWNLLAYAAQSVGGFPRNEALPAIQKSATFALLLWALVVVWWPRGGPRLGPGHGRASAAGPAAEPPPPAM